MATLPILSVRCKDRIACHREALSGHSPRHAAWPPRRRNSAGNPGALAEQINSHGVPLARMTFKGSTAARLGLNSPPRSPLVKCPTRLDRVIWGPGRTAPWTIADAELDKTTARVTATLPEGTRALLFHAFRRARLRGVERARRVRPVAHPATRIAGLCRESRRTFACFSA